MIVSVTDGVLSVVDSDGGNAVTCTIENTDTYDFRFVFINNIP